MKKSWKNMKNHEKIMKKQGKTLLNSSVGYLSHSNMFWGGRKTISTTFRYVLRWLFSFLGFLQASWKLFGNSRSGKCVYMIFHDFSWFFMIFHDFSWFFMIFCVFSWFWAISECFCVLLCASQRSWTLLDAPGCYSTLLEGNYYGYYGSSSR